MKYEHPGNFGPNVTVLGPDCTNFPLMDTEERSADFAHSTLEFSMNRLNVADLGSDYGPFDAQDVSMGQRHGGRWHQARLPLKPGPAS